MGLRGRMIYIDQGSTGPAPGSCQQLCPRRQRHGATDGRRRMKRIPVRRLAGFAAATFAIAMALTAVAQGEVKMSIWGHTADGTPIPIYTLTSGQIAVRVMAYGAKIV